MRVKWGTGEIETEEPLESFQLKLVKGANTDGGPRYVMEARDGLEFYGVISGAGYTADGAAKALRNRMQQMIIKLELLLESHS